MFYPGQRGPPGKTSCGTWDETLSKTPGLFLPTLRTYKSEALRSLNCKVQKIRKVKEKMSCLY